MAVGPPTAPSRGPADIPLSQRVRERQKGANVAASASGSSGSLHHSRADVLLGGGWEELAGLDGGFPSPAAAATTTSPTTTSMTVPNPHPNSSWLLRLFESEFFDANLAVYYLHKYPSNIGIQHYICRQLRGFQDQDLEFLLPQLCHMVVNEHTESYALESFIYHMCATSHLGLLIYWYVQAYLMDAKATMRNYKTCRRINERLEVLLFSENGLPPGEEGMAEWRNGSTSLVRTTAAATAAWRTGPASGGGLGSPRRPPLAQLDLKHNVESCFVGMGILLGTLATPELYSVGAEMVLSQGRVRDKPDVQQLFDAASFAPTLGSKDTLRDSPSLEELSYGRAFSPSRQSLAAVRHSSSSLPVLPARLGLVTSPEGAPMASLDAAPLEGEEDLVILRKRPTRSLRSTRSSVLGDAECPIDSRSPSTAALPLPLAGPEVVNDPDTVAGRRATVKFITTLVSIADRLVSVSKDSRMPTLNADLCLLNHNFPANICLPLWCPANQHKPHHHRVVRICPEEGVVLNSADRVPFLLMIEVLEEEPTSVRDGESNMLGDSGLDAVGTSGHMSHSSGRGGSPLSLEEAETHFQRVIAERKTMVEMMHHHPRQKHPHPGQPGAFISDGNEATALAPPPPRIPTAAGDSPIHPTPEASFDPEEFTERMKTAAILLAQLHAQQQKELQLLDTSGQAEKQGGPGALLPHGGPVSPPVPPAKRGPVLQQYDVIRRRVLREMMRMEEARIAYAKQRDLRPDAVSPLPTPELAAVVAAQDEGREAEGYHSPITSKRYFPPPEASLTEPTEGSEVLSDDPSAASFRESWDQKRRRIQAASPFGHHKNWRLLSVIIKSGADLRQEQLALQLIRSMQHIWVMAGVPVWVLPFRIMITSDSSGIIETIRNAVSIHSIKKDGYSRHLNRSGLPFTLYDHFVKTFGQPGCDSFRRAQDNFMRSLAGYSLVSYLLQIKDRHNGNILLDDQGHCIHIDFGFMLSNSPGSVGFELAPFKLPQDYIDVLGGLDSATFHQFKQLLKRAFLALRKRAEELVGLVEMMEKDSRLPCFHASAERNDAAPHVPYPVSAAFRERFQLALPDPQVHALVERLVESSCNNIFTRLYDSFQYYSNNIL